MTVSRYLDFVKRGVQTLIERQSAHASGRPDGALCITVTKQSSKTYRMIGGKHGDTRHTYLSEEQPMEMEPYRLDVNVWPVLDLLSEVTGTRSIGGWWTGWRLFSRNTGSTRRRGWDTWGLRLISMRCGLRRFRLTRES